MNTRLTISNQHESHTNPIKNVILRRMGATSWNDAALSILVYAFLGLFVLSFLTVTVTYVGSLFSGLRLATG